MRRTLLYTLLFAVALSAASCRRAVERARENIRVEAVERIERHGLREVEVVVRVSNGTGYKLLLDTARLDLFYASNRVGDIRLRESVEVPRRAVTSVSTRWQLRISDPMALYVLVRKVQQNDLSDVAVSYFVEGRGGPVSVNILRQMVPVSEFLNTFGLTSQDVVDYLTSIR